MRARPGVRDALVWAVLGVAALSASAQASERGDAALAGLYYLNGVTEVGSQLRLRADGRFDYALAYGGLDQSASGRWQREGERIVLRAELPQAAGEGLYRLAGSEPWDANAEEALLHQDRQAEVLRTIERCPFAFRASSDYPALTIDGPVPAAERAQRERAASAALAGLAQARTALEARGVEALADASAMVPALDAAQAYDRALHEAEKAYVAAGLEWSAPVPPRLPAACAEPAEIAEVPPPADWRGGYMAIATAPELRMMVSEVPVRFEFSDGHTVLTVSDHSGRAGTRPRPGARLIALSLWPPGAWPEGGQSLPRGEPQGTPERIAVAPAGHAVLRIDLDARAVAGPAFETMELRVDGDGLVPTWPDGRERGRYQR